MQLTDLWGLWFPTGQPEPTDIKLDVGGYVGDITLVASLPPEKKKMNRSLPAEISPQI